MSCQSFSCTTQQHLTDYRLQAFSIMEIHNRALTIWPQSDDCRYMRLIRTPLLAAMTLLPLVAHIPNSTPNSVTIFSQRHAHLQSIVHPPVWALYVFKILCNPMGKYIPFFLNPPFFLNLTLLAHVHISESLWLLLDHWYGLLAVQY